MIWAWIGFSFFLIIMLAIDGHVVNRSKYSAHRSMRHALLWTLVWVAMALLFNFIFWRYLLATTSAKFANEQALNFLTGYIIEKSLSIDNLFVFYMVFHQLRIPLAYQQRVFSYGIWSAVVLRLLLILMGSWLVAHFHWALSVMGVFLFATGIKTLLVHEDERDLSLSKFSHWTKKFFRATHEFHGKRFFIKKNKLLYVTPLFIALIFIEFSDIVFALDSIPAIFAITTDPFIVWTSNIFAILGLRALYFLLAGMIKRFDVLKYAIALILIFVGLKMLIMPWVAISVGVSLCIIASILLLFTVYAYVKY
ncbi:MAG: hypothetical protein A3F43_02740 [Gammaproteobacteria bacterium RIFCSPHIGHO2_12_FULL_42_10]|nr:MAG: hypothetical protein A3F43_02740 [Gammaproteobacteria bacterium RIFCSPHIGHO2_12_FULL_42_10]